MKVENSFNAVLTREITKQEVFIRKNAPEHYEILISVMQTYRKGFINFVTELLERPLSDHECESIRDLLQINNEMTLAGLLDIKSGGELEPLTEDDIDELLYDDAA